MFKKKKGCTSINCSVCYDGICTVCMYSEMFIDDNNVCVSTCN